MFEIILEGYKNFWDVNIRRVSTGFVSLSGFTGVIQYCFWVAGGNGNRGWLMPKIIMYETWKI